MKIGKNRNINEDYERYSPLVFIDYDEIASEYEEMNMQDPDMSDAAYAMSVDEYVLDMGYPIAEESYNKIWAAIVRFNRESRAKFGNKEYDYIYPILDLRDIDDGIYEIALKNDDEEGSFTDDEIAYIEEFFNEVRKNYLKESIENSEKNVINESLPELKFKYSSKIENDFIEYLAGKYDFDVDDEYYEFINNNDDYIDYEAAEKSVDIINRKLYNQYNDRDFELCPVLILDEETGEVEICCENSYGEIMEAVEDDFTEDQLKLLRDELRALVSGEYGDNRGITLKESRIVDRRWLRQFGNDRYDYEDGRYYEDSPKSKARLENQVKDNKIREPYYDRTGKTGSPKLTSGKDDHVAKDGQLVNKPELFKDKDGLDDYLAGLKDVDKKGAAMKESFHLNESEVENEAEEYLDEYEEWCKENKKDPEDQKSLEEYEKSLKESFDDSDELEDMNDIEIDSEDEEDVEIK